MEPIQIQRKEIEQNGTQLMTRIFLIDDEVYKLMKLYEEKGYEQDIEEFIQLVEYLQEDIYFNELVKPKQILKVEGESSIRYGYTMEYLSDHETLENVLTYATIKQKKNYFYQIATILKKLHSINMAYDDLHDNNVMINNTTGKIRFIDPDSVKVFGVNTTDLKRNEIQEKMRFVELILKHLYTNQLSFNYYYKLTDKLKGLQVSKPLIEYIDSLERGINPDELITDFSDDLSKDVIRFNKKIITRRGL